LGFTAGPEVPITDSGYASGFNPLLLDPQPELVSDNPSSANRAACEGSVDYDAETTYSAATTIAQVDTRRYMAELSDQIIKKLGQDVDLRNLENACDVFPELIKAFCIKIGLESSSQMNRDIMYFIHKHHR
jgi:hypothetical protein